MLPEFEKYLRTACACSQDNTFLLAVSGGIDSVAMAHLFREAGLKISIAHCNFQLRGKESDGDQQFVEELALRMKVPCYVSRFETTIHANNNGISIQMAARDLRYAWFEELRQKQDIDRIAVGHNKNDVVETMLINFARGTGIRGLSGIKPQQGFVIRPLLFASRQEIIAYCTNRNITWREDSSNAGTKYIRNRIRHVLIPEFETLNPSFLQHAADTISRLQQAEKLVNYALESIKREVWTELPDRYLIHIGALKKFPAIETLLYELLRGFGCDPLTIGPILSSFESTSGKRFYTRTHCITRDRTYLIITKNTNTAEDVQYIEAETAMTNFPLHLSFKTIRSGNDFVIPTEKRFGALDADKLIYPLKLRRWKPGDAFRPLGLKGSKKISDYLINSKVPLPDKLHTWVLESGNTIAWLVNHRIDDRYKITNETHNILLTEYLEKAAE
jgi:tRNA(Ile)-lysidine synthase